MAFGIVRATVLGLMERPEPVPVAEERLADGSEPELPHRSPTSGAQLARPPPDARGPMTYRVHVRVMPRAGLLDPQGQAVEHALSALGFAEAAGVRVGRAIELDVAAPSRAEAEARARQMCDKLLANPVTEDYLLQVEES